MEIAEIYYKAKDGRLFTDPLECENYEKKLGVLPGSVGELIASMEEKMGKEDYLFGMVLVKEADGKKSIYTRATVCVDEMLEDFVNVEDLRKEQRYIYETAGHFLKKLKKLGKDLPCQYMLIWSSDIDLSAPGIMANKNPEVWK